MTNFQPELRDMTIFGKAHAKRKDQIAFIMS